MCNEFPQMSVRIKYFLSEVFAKKRQTTTPRSKKNKIILKPHCRFYKFGEPKKHQPYKPTNLHPYKLPKRKTWPSEIRARALNVLVLGSVIEKV